MAQFSLTDILEKVQGVKKSGNEYKAQCPAHDDKNPSLSITEKDGKTLLYCHAGCTQQAVLDALGIVQNARQKPKERAKKSLGTIVKVYDYTDTNGQLIYQAVRYEPKAFRQRRPDPENPGQYLQNLGGITPVLYRLPDVIRAVAAGETILVCEGEKDADTAVTLGFVATTNPMGAGKWKESYSQTLKGADIVLIPDQDKAGKAHESIVTQALTRAGCTVRVVNLPIKDLTDWVNDGNNENDLKPLLDVEPFKVQSETEITKLYVPPEEQQNGTRPPGAVRDMPSTPLSDVTNAEDLIEQHGEDLRYCYPWRKWLVWAGTCWHLDDIGGVMRRCKETVKDLLRRATYVKDELLFSHMMTHAKASLSAQRLSAMATVAQSEEGIPILPEAIDANTWLLNCRNGTVDLKTGTLRPHDRTDYITLCLDVDYDPNAQCPTWERFLLDIMGGNTGLVEFLQRAVGYSITGEVSEQAFLILWGEGENGKSTFINALLHLLGDYAMKAPTELLMMTGQQDRHPTEKADLAGKRFVATIETEENRRLAEVLIKELTGGDKIRARHMREDFWEFWPTHTIWLATNHRPEIRGTDRAIWRRIRLIPFTRSHLPHSLGGR